MRFPGPSPAQAGTTWLCSVQPTTGSPASVPRKLGVLLGVTHGRLERRVRQLHDVGSGIRRQLEPTGEVRVQDVEAAGAEAEVERLGVHDDLVAQRDGAREPRIGDAGAPVHLEAREAGVALVHRRHAPTPQCQHALTVRGRAPGPPAVAVEPITRGRRGIGEACHACRPTTDLP